MGLFDLFKKKKDDNMEPIDGIPPSTWLPTPPPVYDYDRTRTSKSTSPATTKKQYPTPPDRLDENGELPYGWIYAHKDFTQKIESEYRQFLHAWLDSKTKAPLEQYAALKSFVMYMNDVQAMCKRKGECYDCWRSVLFTDDFYQKSLSELKNFEANFKTIEAEYKAKQEFEKHVLPTLEIKIMEIINDTPGILQKDLYKLFPSEAKSHIQEKLYYAEKNYKIIREKSGNTYKLYIKNK